jgi:hypothetical protein
MLSITHDRSETAAFVEAVNRALIVLKMCQVNLEQWCKRTNRTAPHRFFYLGEASMTSHKALGDIMHLYPNPNPALGWKKQIRWTSQQTLTVSAADQEKLWAMAAAPRPYAARNYAGAVLPSAAASSSSSSSQQAQNSAGAAVLPPAAASSSSSSSSSGQQPAWLHDSGAAVQEFEKSTAPVCRSSPGVQEINQLSAARENRDRQQLHGMRAAVTMLRQAQHVQRIQEHRVRSSATMLEQAQYVQCVQEQRSWIESTGSWEQQSYNWEQQEQPWSSLQQPWSCWQQPWSYQQEEQEEQQQLWRGCGSWISAAAPDLSWRLVQQESCDSAVEQHRTLQQSRSHEEACEQSFKLAERMMKEILGADGESSSESDEQ